jgi:small conductance mechanosensitive channel
MQILREFLQNVFANHTNLYEWTANLFVSLIMIVVWVLIGVFVTFLVRILIKHLLLHRRYHHGRPREKTIVRIFIGIINAFFWFYIIVMMISELGFDVLPILASAGILGFAIAFGAQELIRDIIAGFFLVFEHAYDVDDVIEINDVRGKVVELGLRRTKIINPRNEYIMIKNGDIRQVINISRHISIGLTIVHVPKIVDPKIFKSDAFNELLASYEGTENLLTIPVYQGIVGDDQRTYHIRVRFEANTTTHVPLENMIRTDIVQFIHENASLSNQNFKD